MRRPAEEPGRWRKGGIVIGLLIATHGNFGRELQSSCELITGRIDDCHAFGLERDDSVQELAERVAEVIDDHEQVLCLVDLLGGSPSNVVHALQLTKGNVAVVTGLNLAMLIQAAESRSVLGLPELAEHVAGVARASINAHT